MKKKLMIIAEIGVNHNGSLKLAKKLVDKAKWAGADYIKIQNYIPELIVTKKTPKADYQKKNDGIQGNMYKMLKKYHFNFSKTTKLINYCKKKKINFMSSPFDEKSLKLTPKTGFWRITRHLMNIFQNSDGYLQFRQHSCL